MRDNIFCSKRSISNIIEANINKDKEIIKLSDYVRYLEIQLEDEEKR